MITESIKSKLKKILLTELLRKIIKLTIISLETKTPLRQKFLAVLKLVIWLFVAIVFVKHILSVVLKMRKIFGLQR